MPQPPQNAHEFARSVLELRLEILTLLQARREHPAVAIEALVALFAEFFAAGPFGDEVAIRIVAEHLGVARMSAVPA